MFFDNMIPSTRSQFASGRRANTFYRRYGKRTLDIAVVLASLPIFLPIIAIVAGLVALDGGKPFYLQDRIGRRGRVFKLLKIRTMVPNADERLEQHLSADPAARAEWDATQKLKNDPRIIPIGRFLRRSSLDELPQLLNVLMGHMSVVGPRPMMCCQRTLYPGTDYYLLFPGITGNWQISDRHETKFATRARYDSEYMSTQSLGTDLGIMMQTVRVVLRGTGV
ncbi:sugar transferase [uncultured Tateyamaria sp.]|uniref:sugar transferase n=1 Tax=uncultured Tateyamaria sp. TaxID=455651 RepID=UPI0026089AEC|nr:sugar transferase [uncultured Tateyamaria sp.]